MTTEKLWKSLQLNSDKIVSGHDQSKWTIGEWRSVPAPTKECIGLNCCPNIIDAMGYVNMEVLAEVEIDGATITSNDKITSEKMRILRAWKWEKKDSVALSSYAAGLVEDNFNSWAPTDSRVRDCNAIVRKWLEDPTSVSDGELRSAESAVRSAESAWSAAGSVVWPAAWPAAGSAAWSAESAWSAARSAESERQKMRNKIHRWVVKHISNLEEIKA